jgi:glycosyltransferase involved in cell wall biosynthesis
VPYLAVEAMADRLAELLTRADLRHGFGQRAAAKVRERHSLEVAAPRLVQIIRAEHGSEALAPARASA